ncbi:MAG TPA: iron transporter [Solirubrobacteraceae bacterium]|nr:iron transporter [Solirubrobacteraceae bacterium]
MSTAAKRATRPVALALVALLVSGCAAADKHASATGSSSSAGAASASMSTGGMDMSSASGAGSASGGAASAGGTSPGGIKPVPMQVLGTATWQGMKITAQAMTAVPFVVYDGSTEKMVKPPGASSSLHLMVMLNDAYTDVPIPYAGVWATITKDGKVVFDERQWPMISRYMGPHYGNDVVLPGAGTYQLSLLISPPVSARHVEYADVWLKPHRVTFTFPWKPSS